MSDRWLSGFVTVLTQKARVTGGLSRASGAIREGHPMSSHAGSVAGIVRGRSRGDLVARRGRERESRMTRDAKKTPAGRWLVGTLAAVLAVSLVLLAFALWPKPRPASSPGIDQPAVADVTLRRSYPANEATPAVVPDHPSNPAAGNDAPAASAGPTLCGGKVCKEDQFCCGPPACGYCANKMTGPECPTKCP
jgi:hypothetical protein